MDDKPTPRIELLEVRGTPDASDVLWEILQERDDPEDADTNISHKQTPSREDHDLFVINNPFWKWFLIRCDGEWVGQIRVTARNEIGVGLLRKYRGRGIGTEAVRTLIEMYDPQPEIKSVRRAGWIANINPRNERSIKMFEALGFRHIQNTYMRDGGHDD